MNPSDILNLFAKVNRRAGYDKYADMLEDSAVVYKANEIVREGEE